MKAGPAGVEGTRSRGASWGDEVGWSARPKPGLLKSRSGGEPKWAAVASRPTRVTVQGRGSGVRWPSWAEAEVAASSVQSGGVRLWVTQCHAGLRPASRTSFRGRNSAPD